jgi:hypothetical protein
MKLAVLLSLALVCTEASSAQKSVSKAENTLKVTSAMCTTEVYPERGGMCFASASIIITTKDGDQSVNWRLSCYMAVATCLQLQPGRSYGFDIDSTLNCDDFGKKYDCMVVHGRPYDVIYTVVKRDAPKD